MSYKGSLLEVFLSKYEYYFWILRLFYEKYPLGRAI